MGFEDLLAIRKLQRQYAEEELSPVACPNDGTPLDEVNGILHCRFDGWTCEASGGASTASGGGGGSSIEQHSIIGPGLFLSFVIGA